MKNRPAFELRGVIKAYNIFQIIFNAWMVVNIFSLTWFNGYSLVCQPVDYSYSQEALKILKIGYFFYLSKIIDLCDTVFFVLRKKNDQITFLHVFHHGFMPISAWPCFRFVAGGHAAFVATFNSFVHFVMYFYYLLASMGPNVQKYLWWKKYLTSLQMIQFVCVALHSFQLLFVDCGFPTIYFWWAIAQAVLFLSLFRNFYVKAYKKTESNQGSYKTSSDQEKKLSWISYKNLFLFANPIFVTKWKIAHKISH